MVGLLLQGYCTGLGSSRVIGRRRVEDMSFACWPADLSPTT
jgi:hypothetical protein